MFKVVFTLVRGPSGVFIKCSECSTWILTLIKSEFEHLSAPCELWELFSSRRLVLCSVSWNFILYMCTLVFSQWCKMNDVENSETSSSKLPLLSNYDAQIPVGSSHKLWSLSHNLSDTHLFHLGVPPPCTVAKKKCLRLNARVTIELTLFIYFLLEGTVLCHLSIFNIFFSHILFILNIVVYRERKSMVSVTPSWYPHFVLLNCFNFNCAFHCHDPT